MHDELTRTDETRELDVTELEQVAGGKGKGGQEEEESCG
jgi:hypothetical protein